MNPHYHLHPPPRAITNVVIRAHYIQTGGLLIIVVVHHHRHSSVNQKNVLAEINFG